MIKITFQCGGCAATTSARLQRRFVSVSGRSWGLGSYVEDKIEDVVPKDWVAFDPYTSCTYCPSCWTEILAQTPDETADCAN